MGVCGLQQAKISFRGGLKTVFQNPSVLQTVICTASDGFQIFFLSAFSQSQKLRIFLPMSSRNVSPVPRVLKLEKQQLEGKTSKI